MNTALWVVAALLAVVFLATGSLKAFGYEQARERLSWVNEAPRAVPLLIGIAEILGALGLILPAATGILPWLTPLAAVCLAIVMVLASLFHASRHEYQELPLNLLLLVLALFVAYGRIALVPLA